MPNGVLPAELLPAAARLREARPTLALAAGWRPGPHGACPLCGLGEAGAEHLLTWCPAAAAAWRRWSGDEISLEAAALGQGAYGRRMAIFLHQLAYLSSALLGRAEVTSEQATGRLLRACAMGRGGNDRGEDEVQAEEEDGDEGEEETDATLGSHVWSAEGP